MAAIASASPRVHAWTCLVQLAAETPTRSALTAHSLDQSASSRLRFEDRFNLLRAKKWPVTCSRSGADATWIDVAAPLGVVLMNGRIIGANSRSTRPGSSAPNDVRTTPGCNALAVTEVGWVFQ